jgi:hypothetical protein
MRKILVLICLSATLATAQTKPSETKPAEATSAQQTAAPESYPVWWEPSILGLEKLVDVDAQLAEPFSPDDLSDLRDMAHHFSGPSQPEVHNCKELLAVIDPDDYRSLNRVNVWGQIGVRCAELRELSHAVPALHSAVRGTKWTNRLFSQLPAGIAYADDENTHQDVLKAEKNGLSLLQYWKGKGSHSIGIDGQAILLRTNAVSDDGYNVVARGDFNGDGWEDLMIDVGGGSGPAIYHSAFIVTRKSTNERFVLVKTIF